MKSYRLLFTTFVLLILITATFLFSPLVNRSNAGTISNSYIYLDDMAGGRTSGVQMIITVNPAQAFTSPDLVITFPDSEDGDWCVTAGALVATGVDSSAIDNGGSTDIDAELPTGSSLSADCTQGSGAGSYDTITISDIDALSSGTVYGVMIDDSGAGVLGTAAAGSHLVTVSIAEGLTIDSITYGVYTVADDTVTVSATVAEANTVSCSLSATSVNLGTLFQGGAYSTASHTITASTSAGAAGYYWAVYGQGDGSTDAGLYKSTATTDLLASTGSTTINLNTSEGFGIAASQPSGATVVSDFSDAVPGTFGAIDRAFAGARLVLYQASAETSGDTSTVTYGGRAGTAAETGSYSETVTWVCGGYY